LLGNTIQQELDQHISPLIVETTPTEGEEEEEEREGEKGEEEKGGIEGEEREEGEKGEEQFKLKEE